MREANSVELKVNFKTVWLSGKRYENYTCPAGGAATLLGTSVYTFTQAEPEQGQSLMMWELDGLQIVNCFLGLSAE